MTTDQAVHIARRCALESPEVHGYMPLNDCEARVWQPHPWVIDAILFAARFAPKGASMSVPTIGRTVILLGLHSNGADTHPAVITRSWSDRSTAEGPVAVNLTVFPDNRAPECRTSVMLFHSEEGARAHHLASKTLAAYWPPRVP